MRFYDVAIASLAIDAPRKWTDNTLSQNHFTGVVSASRGVPRRIGYPALLRLAVVREFHMQLGIGVADALAIAERALAPGADGVHSSGMLLVRVDLVALERRLQQRLSEALESAPSPRRGRPPGRTKATRGGALPDAPPRES